MSASKSLKFNYSFRKRFEMYNFVSRLLIVGITTSLVYGEDLADPEKCDYIGGKEICVCIYSFPLNNNRRTCVPSDNAWTLLFASSTTIFSLIGDDNTLGDLQQLNNVTRNDYGNFQHLSSDAINNIVHWTDIALGQEGVYKISIDGTGEPNVVVDTGVFYPEGIAFDWITGNIYFVDKLLGYIAVCSLNSTRCAVVVQITRFGENKISAITLHPNHGLMFWTQQGPNPLIKRAEMDGSNPETIVSKNLYWPNGITVDEANSRIYWVSGAKGLDTIRIFIESCKFDGSDRRKVLQSDDNFGVDTFGDYLFFTHWHTGEVKVANKFGGSVTTIDNEADATGLTVHHVSKQQYLRINPCDKLSCSHLCALSGFKNGRCLCPVGMLRKRRLCVDDTDHPKLLIARANSLFLFQVNTVGKDVFEKLTLPEEIKAISAMVYNPINNKIIISDDLSKKIFDYDLVTLEYSILVHSNIINVALLDIDVVGENLFWYDAAKFTIEIMSLHTKARMSLATNIKNVHDILVVPNDGALYISKTNQAGNEVHINKLMLNQKITETTIFKLGPARPVQLVYSRINGTILSIFHDNYKDKIKVMDERNIEYRSKVNPGGMTVAAVQIRNQTFLIDEMGQLKVVTTYFNARLNEADHTDWFTQKINFKGFHTNSTLISRTVLTAVDRNIDYLENVREQHDCSAKNSRRKACSHICLPTNVKFLGKCWCPNHLSLKQDELTCTNS